MNMNDNLSEMIKQAEEPQVSFQDSELDLPEETDEAQASEEEQVEQSQSEESVVEEAPTNVVKASVTNLYDWFNENKEKFPDLKPIRIATTGVKTERYLVVTVPDLSGEKDEETGEIYRELRKYDDANVHPVLDLPGYDMKAHNSGFVLYYHLGNDVVVKAYGVRTGLILVACYNLAGVGLIPYNIGRVRRKDTEVNIPLNDGVGFAEKMELPLDKEALQLRYKQSSKAVDDFTTNRDAVKWLLERQADMFDINHLFQIDNVLLETLA